MHAKQDVVEAIFFAALKKTEAAERSAFLEKVCKGNRALRARVEAIVSDSGMGRFGLEANQITPYNVFVPLEWLQEKVDDGAEDARPVLAAAVLQAFDGFERFFF